MAPPPQPCSNVPRAWPAPWLERVPNSPACAPSGSSPSRSLPLLAAESSELPLWLTLLAARGRRLACRSWGHAAGLSDARRHGQHPDVVCRPHPSTAHGLGGLRCGGGGESGHLRRQGSCLGIRAIWVCLWVRSHLTCLSSPRVGHTGAHSRVTSQERHPEGRGHRPPGLPAEGLPSWPCKQELEKTLGR